MRNCEGVCLAAPLVDAIKCPGVVKLAKWTREEADLERVSNEVSLWTLRDVG